MLHTQCMKLLNLCYTNDIALCYILSGNMYFVKHRALFLRRMNTFKITKTSIYIDFNSHREIFYKHFTAC